MTRTITWTLQQLADYKRRTQPQAAPKAKDPKTANKTEADALTILNLEPGDVVFEGRTFPICGGCVYTPDWYDELREIAIEVKGERIHSRDSRQRFNQAKHLYPELTWIWCRKRTKGAKGSRWEIEVYEKV
jgi:hypothetical protein